MTNKRTRAVAYLRVSSQRQVIDGHGLDTQKKMIIDMAERENIEIIRFFEEKGESAKNTNRTQLKKMLHYIELNHNSIDHIIAYDTDRIARNVEDYLQIRRIAKEHGIKFKYVNSNFADDEDGRLMEIFKAAFDQHENEKRAKKCTDGSINAIKAGRYTHPAPRRYVNGRDANNQRNIILSDNEDFVRAIAASWKLIANGLSCEDARKEVNGMLKEMGERTIPKQSFSDMIHNEIYIGIIHSHGLVVDSPLISHLIDTETFYQVQSILSKQKKRGNRYSKYNPAYPLRGILFCKNHHRMTASSPKGRNDHYPKYCCQKCHGVDAANYDVDTVNSRYGDFFLL